MFDTSFDQGCANPACSRTVVSPRVFCSLSCQMTVENRRRAFRRLVSYAVSPKRCRNGTCGVTLPYDKRQNRFCSQSCAATHNQLGGPGRHFRHPKHPCEMCGEPTRNPRFCRRACSEQARREASHRAIEAADGVGFAAGTLRRYMLTRFTACAICGLEEWQGRPAPLVMDHIDGDSSNDRLGNLRMVCANCDAQLPTCKSKNRGKGRAWRRERYRQGQSY